MRGAVRDTELLVGGALAAAGAVAAAAAYQHGRKTVAEGGTADADSTE